MSVTETAVAELKALGKEVLGAKYSTKYSEWSIENPELITGTFVVQLFDTLSLLSSLSSLLSLLFLFSALSSPPLSPVSLPPLFSSSHSSFSQFFPGRENTIDQKWQELSELSQEKKRVLDDHLAREEFSEKVRMMNRGHVDRYAKLVAWVTEKQLYLQKKESVTNVGEARTALRCVCTLLFPLPLSLSSLSPLLAFLLFFVLFFLSFFSLFFLPSYYISIFSLLEHYGKEKQSMTQRNVSQLKQQGAHILAQKYETSYSSYVFENPEEIHGREKDIDSK